MKEVKVKRFWRIEKIEPTQRTKRVMEKWIVPTNIKMIGARIILLTLASCQKELDLYGVVTRDPKEDFEHSDLKKDHIFYGQRDCYSKCSGVHDLIILDYLPYPCYFPVKKGESLYFKGKADMAPSMSCSEDPMFDILIDLLYIEE